MPPCIPMYSLGEAACFDLIAIISAISLLSVREYTKESHIGSYACKRNAAQSPFSRKDLLLQPASLVSKLANFGKKNSDLSCERFTEIVDVSLK